MAKNRFGSRKTQDVGHLKTVFHNNSRTSVLYSKISGFYEKKADILSKKFKDFPCFLVAEKVYLMT